MSSLDLHQLCEDLPFVCKVMPRYLGLRLQHLNLRGHDVTPHTDKGSEVGTDWSVPRMEGWPSWLLGVNPGVRTGHQARNQITWCLMGLGDLWLSCAQGRKGPECPGLGASGTLSPSLQPHGNRSSLRGAETLLRFRPMALIVHLHSPTVNRDPPPDTRKEVRLEVRVVGSPAVVGCDSVPQRLLRCQTR